MEGAKYRLASEKILALQWTVSALEREIELEEAKESETLLSNKNAAMEKVIANNEENEVKLQITGAELKSTKEELQNLSKALEEERTKNAASNQDSSVHRIERLTLMLEGFGQKLRDAVCPSDVTRRLSSKDYDTENERDEQVAKLNFALKLKDHVQETLSRGSLVLLTELRDSLTRTKGELSKKEEEFSKVEEQKKKAEESALSSAQTLQQSQKREQELQQILDKTKGKQIKMTSGALATASKVSEEGKYEKLASKLRWYQEQLKKKTELLTELTFLVDRNEKLESQLKNQIELPTLLSSLKENVLYGRSNLKYISGSKVRIRNYAEGIVRSPVCTSSCQMYSKNAISQQDRTIVGLTELCKDFLELGVQMGEQLPKSVRGRKE